MTSRTLRHEAVGQASPRGAVDSAAHPASSQAGTPRAGWPWIKRGLTLAFFVVVAVFTVRYARNVDWKEVWQAIVETPLGVLLGAMALAACSHGLYSCFDLLGRRYTGHDLPVPAVMQVNFISYAFNLTIGSLVGGVGFRYRLYSQAGLAKGVITRIVSMSMLTNWLGYKLLAGLLFIFHPLVLPPAWHMGNHGLQCMRLSWPMLEAVR